MRYSSQSNISCSTHTQSPSKPQQAALPDLVDCPTDLAAQTEWYKNKFMLMMHEQCFGIHNAYNWTTVPQPHSPYYRKPMIPDVFVVPQLQHAGGFETLLLTLIIKVHAAFHGFAAAPEWIAKVKRDPDFDKYERADGFQELDVKLAAALT